MGATGKSAQLPLYVWLPDAMEGPTPVSALIHAATMVTAGVYMVARSHVLFMHAPTAMYVVAIVGCATAIFAATIGLVQPDIKKVLAYSTVSQLGYMFLACGVGAFGAGIFHLMTHAFFKALLFLSAGSVIHAMGGEQDMWHMGGLASKIKVTFWCMLFGTIAIAGFAPFAGFFSKDAILFAAYQSENGGKALYGVGLLAAIFTSFYMFRLIWLTFFGEKRYDEHQVHVHESPGSMTVPLMILALLSLVGGWLAAPALWGGPNYFADFLAPVFGNAEAAGGEATNSLELTLSIVAVIAATVGLIVAWRMYSGKADARHIHRASQDSLQQILRGRTLPSRDCRASGLAVTKRLLEGRGRGHDRRQRQRDCAWHRGSRRHRAAHAIRQCAQLCGLGDHWRSRDPGHHLLAVVAPNLLRGYVRRGTLMELSGHLLSVLIFFPAFGALALLLLRGDDQLWIRRLTFVVSVVEFVFSLFLLRGVPISAPGYSRRTGGSKTLTCAWWRCAARTSP